MDSGNDWPTTVSTTLSPGKFVDEFATGGFTSTGTARECGPNIIFPSGFLFGFPHDTDPHDIEDVTFSAAELTPGTSTTAFYISVNISEEAGHGALPATVLDTTNTNDSASGTASLSLIGGQRSLTVDASDKDGISIHLTAACSPI